MYPCCARSSRIAWDAVKNLVPTQTRADLSAPSPGSDYCVQTGPFAPGVWSEVLGAFSDANIFQAWSYEAVRSGSSNVSHLVLKRGAVPVAAAQARLVRIPCLGSRLAYIRWGPLWQSRGVDPDVEVFREVVRALRREYVERRRMAIRVAPHIEESECGTHRAILEQEGYVELARRTPYQTILMDIRPSLEELNRGLHQKWRNCLSGARKRNLEVVEGEGDELFREFESIYSDMLDRKQFSSAVKPSQFRRIQQELPSGERLHVVVCRTEGRACASVISSAIGSQGLYLLGATSTSGMKTNGSYLAQWRTIEWLKERGCLRYNLHGINPRQNEGVYRFKSRLAGEHGREVHFLGQFDAYPNRSVRLLVRFAEFVKRQLSRRQACLTGVSTAGPPATNRDAVGND